MTSKVGNFGSSMKYKHLFGLENPKSHVYYNLKPSLNNTENNGIAANDKYFAIAYDGGGGPVYVSDLDNYGKVEPDCNVVNGHKASVIDINFSPFKSSIMATASTDCTVNLWDLNGTNQSYGGGDAFYTHIHGHSLRCVAFSPTVDHMLVTCAMDQKTRIFDIEKGKESTPVSSINNEAVVNNISFNYDGTLLVHACKDKCLRIIDPRAAGVIAMKTHDNARLGINVRSSWCSRQQNVDVILTTSSMSGQRLLQLWDPRKLEIDPICSKIVDSESSALFPMYDESSGICFVAGKGDSIIRYYELNFLEEQSNFIDANIEKANEFKTDNTQPIAGICLLPKNLCNVREVEVTKMLKLTQNAVIPITFTLPRQKKEFFQDDIYLPIKASIPSIDFNSFMSSTPGTNIVANYESMKPADMIRLSEKPADMIRTLKTTEFKEKIDKAEIEAKERENVFAKMAQMAIERQQYHPNLSGGSQPIQGKVDAKIMSESEVADDEWDD